MVSERILGTLPGVFQGANLSRALHHTITPSSWTVSVAFREVLANGSSLTTQASS